MNRDPSLSISIRIPNSLWQNIGKLLEIREFGNISEAIRSLTVLGLWVLENKHRIEKPEEIEKIKQEWSTKMMEEGVIEMTQELSDIQVEGLLEALSLERERRGKK